MMARNQDTQKVKRSVTVEVAGLKFTLKTDADEAYVKSLARFVTEKMDEARASSRTVATHNLALLVAMNIADDLFRNRRMAKEFRQRVREKSRSVLEILEKDAKPAT
jgi:cell division protein ZapA